MYMYTRLYPYPDGYAVFSSAVRRLKRMEPCSETPFRHENRGNFSITNGISETSKIGNRYLDSHYPFLFIIHALNIMK